MAAEIKERRRRAWPGSSDRRRDGEFGHQGKRGTSHQGGPGYQSSRRFRAQMWKSGMKTWNGPGLPCLKNTPGWTVRVVGLTRAAFSR